MKRTLGPGARALLATALVLTALGMAREARSEDEPTLPFEKYQLKNGLTVILHRDNKLPLTSVNIWYDVGGLHERPGRSGFAHLFEHMMFQGTPHTGEDMHFRLLQEVGATGINGTTDFDRTNYFETVPSNALELALWLESDRMGFLLASLTKKSLDNQIEVVKNERRQSIENAPYGLAEELLVKTIYPPSHPYHGNVIGSMEDISAATIEDVRDFFRTYYAPANATLTIAGDLEPAQTKQLIEKYFGPLAGRPKPQPVQAPPPAIEKEEVVKFDERVANRGRISIAWMGPSAFQPDTAELELATHVISGVRSSRLDRRVTYDDLLAERVTAHFDERKSGSLFIIEMVVRPERTLEEALEAIDATLADFKARPPTDAELRQAKNAREARLFHSLEVLGGRADRLQTYNLYLGDPGRLAWDIERFRKATVNDVARAIDKYLNDKRVIILATPKGKAGPAAKGN